MIYCFIISGHFLAITMRNYTPISLITFYLPSPKWSPQPSSSTFVTVTTVCLHGRWLPSSVSTWCTSLSVALTSSLLTCCKVKATPFRTFVTWGWWYQICFMLWCPATSYTNMPESTVWIVFNFVTKKKLFLWFSSYQLGPSWDVLRRLIINSTVRSVSMQFVFKLWHSPGMILLYRGWC